MDECRRLREEAAICRDLAREIEDAASIAMFLDRAEQLETRAAALEPAGGARPGARARFDAVEGADAGTYADTVRTRRK